MAASITDQDLKKAIKNILKDADLDSLSAKAVRRKLEGSFGIDLTERKKEIDEMTMKLITEGVEDEEPANKKSKDNGKVVQNGNKKEEKEDEAMDSDVDSDSSFEAPDPVPVIKKKKVEKPKPKTPTSQTESSDNEVDDEKLAKQLQEEEDMNLRTRRRPQKRAPVAKKPKEKKERKGTSMYSKPCQLTPELAAVVGHDQVSRHEIVKRMWEVMRERNLQDQKNKQFMVCDEELQKIFGRKRVRMFGMMKYLTKHIRNMDEVE